MTPFKILLVEDNPGDVRLTREAFAEASVSAAIEIVADGALAWTYLRRAEPFTEATRPDLILLDLNLPRKDGRELLRDVKADPDLRRIPVVVLTTSTYQEDVSMCYDLQANSYIAKPSELDQFVRIVRALDQFWIRTVQLPGRG